MRKQVLAILIAGTVISPSPYSAIPGSSDGQPSVPAAVILADDVPQNNTVPASDKSKVKANGSTELPTTPPTSPVTEATGEGTTNTEAPADPAAAPPAVYKPPSVETTPGGVTIIRGSGS